MLSFTIQPRIKAVYFGQDCDSQSACAKTAREILLLLDKKKDIPHQNQLIKEEIWVMLDHERMLSEEHCFVLAKLTVHELLKLQVKNNSNEELIKFVEELDNEMHRRYNPTPLNHKTNIQALKYKHMGQGMQYLKEIHIKK